VHAVLAGFVQEGLIENQSRHQLDNQLTGLLHELYSFARTKKVTCQNADFGNPDKAKRK
jgi:hypothetical protein